jgi:hypothetical protein
LHALAALRREPPTFTPADVVDSHGVYLIYDTDYVPRPTSIPGPGGCSGSTTPGTA